MLLWADGFEHYGTDAENMLDGLYADLPAAQGTPVVSAAQAATGSYSFYTADGTTGNVNNPRGLRFVLPSAVDRLGVAQHVYFPSLPNSLSGTGNAMILGLFPANSLAASHLSFFVGITGNIVCHRAGDGDSTLMGTELFATDPILTAAAWNHVEIQVGIDDTNGWVRIAINGVHRYDIDGLDTRNGASDIGNVMMSRPFLGQHNSTCRWYIDNLYIYDFEGDSAVYTDWCPTVDGAGVATNYMGEWQCVPITADEDTAEDDWVPSTGTDSAAMVDETSPNDADYIASTAAGDLTEFAITDLPEDITVIRGLIMIGRMSKSDAGPAMVKFGMKSVAAIDDADERPITVEPTYWYDFMNVDPNTSVRWTRASLNAAWFRLTRTA
jgi:hypothetical protein